MEEKTTVARLLRLLTETIERSSAKDVSALLAGHADLVISSPRSVGSQREWKRQTATSKRGHTKNQELSDLAVRLQQLGSRDEGSRLLQQGQLTRKELESLARLMDLPVSRDDDVER